MTEKNIRSQSLYVDDMIKSIEKALAYTKGLDYAGFENDELVKDAVLLNLQIVGEASNHISEEIQKKYPRIPLAGHGGLPDYRSPHLLLG